MTIRSKNWALRTDVGGHGAQLLQRAAAGAGHDQGVVSVVSGVLHDLRAGVTPQENGFDLPAGKLLGEVGQLLVGLDGRRSRSAWASV